MMERLLVMRLQVQGCTAEAFINDIPLGRAGGPATSLCVPVHEYVMEGTNEIRLVVDPSPAGLPTSTAPRVADGPLSATLRLLLPRVGHVGSDELARALGELAWAVPEGAVFEAGHAVSREVELPIRFPRWRWLDVPVIEDVEAQRKAVVAFLHRIAADMLRGDFQSLLAGSRLRLEELALAYQKPVADLAARLVSSLQRLHASKGMKLAVPAAPDIVLRPCAHGRLLDCLDSTGAPVLHTTSTEDSRSFEWPTRLAVVDGHCHIFR